MPPHHPLPDIFVSGRPAHSDYRVLTPRTPHSRAGRAEEGFTEVELEAFQDDDSNAYRGELQQQSQPLLSPGYRSRGDDDAIAKDAETVSANWLQPVFSRLPLIGGSIFAFILLILIAVSLERPGSLETILLHNPAEFLETSSGKSDAVAPATKNSQLLSPTVSEPAATEAANSDATKTTISESVPSPTPVMEHPSARPFISYENYTQFPLTGTQYREQCADMMQYMHHGDYWDEPRKGPLDVEHLDEAPDSPQTSVKVCSKTITYLLDGHVGLVADLALLAQAAALARERNSSFFIDDTHWNRGKWTDYFQDVRGLEPGPEPGCRSPPANELVACPRVARHWVISSSTAIYHFGHAFGEEYQDGHGHHLNRFKNIFERAQTSFEQTIRPNPRMAQLVRAAREELLSILSVRPLPARSDNDEGAVTPLSRDSATIETANNPALYIGVHIRRGDRKPAAIPYYPDDIIPLQKFIDGARSTWDRFYGNASAPSSITAGTDYDDIGAAAPGRDRDVSSGDDNHFPASPIMWLASDSPQVANEFTSAFPPATGMFSLAQSTMPELRALAPAHAYVQAEFNEETPEERARLTRGMIVDFAMLSGMWAAAGDVVPGAVVCGEGSNVCKMSAIGFGFQRAFGFDDGGDHQNGDVNPARARWVDVDIAGRIVPSWHAYEMR